MKRVCVLIAQPVVNFFLLLLCAGRVQAEEIPRACIARLVLEVVVLLFVRLRGLSLSHQIKVDPLFLD